MGRKGTLEVKIVGDHSGLQSSVKSALGTLGKFATSVGAIGIAAAGAIGVKSVKAFMDFDAAMTESLAIMGDVSDAMESDMSDAAREVGKTTKFSATEAAEAYFFLASAGMDAEQQISALPQVASFAQAGMFDMAQATDLATDAQSALGLTSDNTEDNLAGLTRTTDVFVKANTLANASVEQFASAMTTKAGTALKSVGKDIEEGTAALAVFADQGIKGERAGTLLANTLDGLSDRARKSESDFARLGVEVFDADGNMRNMSDIVADLEVGLAGMTVEQREAELAQLGFNKQAQEGILALLGNSEALSDYEGDLNSAAGTTQSVADKQMESFKGQMSLIWSQISDVALSIGQSLVPALEIFAEWLKSHLPAITAFFDNVASKFEHVFTVADDTMGGTVEAMFEAGEAVHGLDNIVKDTLGIETPKQLHGFDNVVGDVTGNTEDNFLTMGQMMERLSQAWQDVFNNDIKPWFNNSFMPWLREDVTPMLVDWGVAAGKAMGKALVSSMAQQFGDVPAGLRRLGQNLGVNIGRDLAAKVNIPKFHGGGQFRAARPGGEGLAILEDREIVLPEGMGGRKAPEITINNYGPTSDYITGRSAALALRMA